MLIYYFHYGQQHKVERAILAALRRARKRNLPDTLTPEELNRLLVIGKATHFGEKLALDHFIPVIKGGGTTLANTHYIPAWLNSSKRDKLPQEVYKQLTFA